MTQMNRTALKEFSRRRKELMALMEENSIAILPSAGLVKRNSDVEYQFRQNSDFYYLTGFAEPESVAVLVPGREHGEMILFCRERDKEAERWNGKITGPERATQLYGADDAFPVSDIDDILPGLIEGKNKLYYAMGSNREFDNQIIDWVKSILANKKRGAQPPGEFVQLGQYLHELRLFKSAQEIRLMKEAASISCEAHKKAMQVAKPGMWEYQLEAEMRYVFMNGGSRFQAYPAIVGSGSNACILHYTDNDALLGKDDLVLIDAGCEYDYYAADITRTFPVSGRFSDPQKQLYTLVLESQTAAIAAVQPGNPWTRPHDEAVRVLTEGMVEYGLLQGTASSVNELIETEAYKKFYMHKTGHWLGLDVHDVGEYQIDGQPRVFEQGMVTTIEPGIYIDEDLDDVPAQFR
ncbi:MAG: aminopeptidase P N-terminal domain-containing protein, partial [Gammaproteobacteria bacterium]|nr:aminopeptidase P N-terminal domain-containing protein [Gammaproteobacteria bacterium]